MRDLDEATDPSPLMLVFSDQDCADSNRRGYYRQILQQQVIAAMLCRLHTAPEANPFTIEAAEILRETTQGAFDYLGRERQNAMMALVKVNVFTTIRDYWRDRESGLVSLKDGVLTLSVSEPAKRNDFFNWLESRKTQFPDSTPTVPAMEQPELFEKL